MSFSAVKERIPDYGRDIRLNLEAVLSPEGAPGLEPKQIWGTALAVSYALASDHLVKAVIADAGADLDDATVEAARGAATIMAMNNVYYRATHLMEDPELKKMPARLRMNVIGKPGIEKVNFELMSFAVSALAGCGQCLTSHLHELRKAGMSDEGVQSSLKIASVLQAAKTALTIRDL
ncbi:MAG TPA: carboxymuconolactone decarboxylase family protein [Bdellovibrionales bacterium]|nr:carboxymuconolactone decarboxylase family protein [Bdellovibrionales bacterium]